ncbi:family 78 glycoside hydrolase catalytic domain [Streptococcus merionis]|uniref:alpha-L-rhamnosidase n=1 Tax=Streptococcus merionis TaxID=400065 RepID=A0A239SWN1_9STRE|nr:family 78 glycoside hydrolase catalytic domain [Streptococcus merionis]SNU89144.1 alfa-L-rhamnosidase [Streptococcus merionis]
MKNTKLSWTGRWISAAHATVSEEPEFTLEEMFSGKSRPQAPVEERLHPGVYFKKELTLSKEVTKAELTITSQGIYQAYINGQRVTGAIFTPDYTDYNDFLMYQTYEVTKFLAIGKNVLAVEVADGWYAGRISVQGGSAQFGDQLALLVDLEITYSDGCTEIVGTDTSFTAGSGKHRYADIQIGEKQDLRLDSDWKTSFLPLPELTFEIDADYERLAPQEGPMVYRQEILPAQKIWSEKDGLIVDFGQVIAGRIRLKAGLADGQEIVVDHAETLDENGHFFRNIVGRNKDARDVFIGRGQKEILEPDFTFHGFRYVKIVGLESLDERQIEAIAIYSEMAQTGTLVTSDFKVNQLLSNILWSQKGNMLSIPTDCPQRERVGWTGDMQVFAPSSTFFLETKAFIKRWLKSVRINQKENGEIVDYSPAPKDAASSVAFTGSYSSAGWGDAIIMVPWTLYQRYGDREVLEENYQAMLNWFAFSKDSAAGDKSGEDRYIWDTKFHYGDWMFPSFMMSEPNPMKTSAVTKDLVATAFLAHSADLLAHISEILGKDGSAFADYARKVRVAFSKYFLTEAGHLTSDFQGCYVLALAFDMVSDDHRQGLVDRLVSMIHENGNRLDTGFLSVPYLLDVLCENGHVDLARTVFFQDACPSWFYEINRGATTIWESWAGIQPDGNVGTFSFNHYAFGCVLDWIIRETVGLKAAAPGYQAIAIAPSLEIVDRFDMTYHSPVGMITIKKDGRIWLIDTPKNIPVTIDLTAVSGRLA